MAHEQEFDVVVVGAGLTGLVAARRCRLKGKSVLVLEARGRVGGRAESVEDDKVKGSIFDLGAHFIGDYPEQQDVWRLVQELKVPIFKQYQGPEGDPAKRGADEPSWAGLGANMLYSGDGQGGIGEPLTFIGPVLPEEPSDLFYLDYLQSLIKDFPLHDPQRLTNAEKLDALSVQDWVTQIDVPGFGKPSETFQALLRLLCRVGFSEEPRNISLLWFLFYIGASGGFDRFQAVRYPYPGAQSHRLVNGAQSIADALVRDLTTDNEKLKPARIQCNTVVTSIEDSDDGVIVHAGDLSFKAKQVLVAMSPTLYADKRKIKFKPALPEPRRLAAEGMKTPSMVLAYVTFDKAFWRDAPKKKRPGTVNGQPEKDVARYGFSGDVLFTSGPVTWMMDTSSASGQPALFAFLVGDEAAALTSPQARETAVLNTLRQVFGDDVDANAPKYHEKDWTSDPFTRGAPAAHFEKGKFFEYGREILLTANAKPHGRVYFASSETSLVANGYMSGAVWSGQRIADQICHEKSLDKVRASREKAMLWCIRTILRAIELQVPSLELPALSKNVEFRVSGGKTLPRRLFKGHRATNAFYQALAETLTVTRVNIESYSADVDTNTGFASFSVAGRFNSNNNPFVGLRGTLVFDFNDPDAEEVLVTRDWLFLDMSSIDTMFEAEPGLLSQPIEGQPCPFTERGRAIAALEHATLNGANFPIRLVRSDVRDANTYAPPLFVAPQQQLFGANGLRTLADGLRASGRTFVGAKFDPQTLTYYSFHGFETQKDARMVVTVRFQDSSEVVVTSAEFMY